MKKISSLHRSGLDGLRQAAKLANARTIGCRRRWQ
jgi:hypothetical protein